MTNSFIHAVTDRKRRELIDAMATARDTLAVNIRNLNEGHMLMDAIIETFLLRVVSKIAEYKTAEDILKGVE